MRIIRIFSFFTSLLALWGCSKATLLNSIIPTSGYSVYEDIAYGTDPRQKLDVYVPDTPDAGKSVLMFFYGGSWQSGDKDLYRFIGQAFTSRGYTVVVANYRLYPQVYFPAFVEDGAASFTWVRKHIAEYGGNPSRIFVSGHSAGAYIALMLTVNNHYLHAAGEDARHIKGVIGLSGPYDFLPITDPTLQTIFSTADAENTQPITFVRRGLPPILLISGDDDKEVGLHNTRNFAAKLKEYGAPVETVIYPGVGHIGLVLSLAYGFRSKAPTLEDMDRFMRGIP